MDAAALLKSQGWRGSGHSLDASDKGIKRPLLVSKKVDVLGLGINKHAAVSDQWWLRAFDQGLQNFGKGGSSTLKDVREKGIFAGGLYGRFVKGESVPGTLEVEEQKKQEDSKVDSKEVDKDFSSDSSDSESSDPDSEDGESRVKSTPDTSATVSESNSTDNEISIADGSQGADATNPHEHVNAARLHLLQHPEDVPADARKQIDRKRKREERPKEKRARRKLEQAENIEERTAANEDQQIAKGASDYEKEQKKLRKKEINRRADEFVMEAIEQGVIPRGSGDYKKRKGLRNGANSVSHGGEKLAIPGAFEKARENMANISEKEKASVKAQKYAREKAIRELKVAAKAYMMGKSMPDERTPEVRETIKTEKHQEKAETKAKRDTRKAEKSAARVEKDGQKAEKLAAKKEQRAETQEKLKADGLLPDLGQLPSTRANTSGKLHSGNFTGNEPITDKFKADVGAIPFADTKDGKYSVAKKNKKTPGVGAIERYTTKAGRKAKKKAAQAIERDTTVDVITAEEAAKAAQKTALKQEKVDRYRATKMGLDLHAYRAKLASGEVQTPKLQKNKISQEKMQEYAKRAAEKGISVEQYIRRREEKYAAKHKAVAENPDVSLGFVVDTDGTSAAPTAAKAREPIISDPS